MAFIKYQFKSGLSKSATTINAFFDDIKGILEGTITATSGFNSTYADINGSVFRGTVPTDYYSSVSKNTNTAANSDNTLQFLKKHSEMTAYRTFYLYDTATGTYDWRARMASAGGTNLVPTNSTSGYTVTTSNTQTMDVDYNQVPTCFMWISESIFLIQIIDGNSAENACSMGMFDYPKSDYDDWAYSSDTNTCPTIFMGDVNVGQFNNATQSNTDSYFVVSNSTYLTSADAIQSASSVSQSYHDTVTTHYGVNYLAIYPRAIHNITSLPLASGKAHQRIPVMLMPYQGNTTSFPLFARLKDLYRTTDDIAQPGTLINYNGVEYAVWMFHKTGGATYNNSEATENSCYLIPTGA